MTNEELRTALALYRKVASTFVPSPTEQPFELIAMQNVLLTEILGRVLGFPLGQIGFNPETLVERLLAGEKISYNEPTEKP